MFSPCKLEVPTISDNRRRPFADFAARLLRALILGVVVHCSPTARGAEPQAHIAIFKEDIPASGAPSSPDYLAAILQRAGFAPTFLASAQLADARELNHDRFDVLVLPYGASFPVSAADNFRAFLHAGGKFFSTGGYAFDNLLERTPNGWTAHRPPTPPALEGVAWFYERLNTRHGRPEDGLETEPTQLGVFQADYPLERARSLATAPAQTILDPALRLDGPLEGWAACGVVGADEARWVPLINAYDSFGRLRGAAGAMLRHYAGRWAGSSWAFFGVTNRDLFAPGQPAMAEAFVSIVRSLTRDVFFASLTTEHSCYRQGEAVKFFIPVFNGGRNRRELRIGLEIYPGETALSSPALSRLATNLSFAVHALPHQTNLVTGQWKPPRFAADFYYLLARLWDGTNEVDRIESGFVVQDPNVLRSGPKLAYRDNYLRFGKRPLFLFGTDDWGYVFNSARETPLQWLRDMRQRRDLGVMLYENLQFGLPRPPAAQEPLLRKVDGIVQLAQKYGQVYFPGLLIGCNAAASDTDLAAQRAWCCDFAGRYAGVPGLIYYLLFNMDETQPERTLTIGDEKPPATVTVARHRPALLWFDGAGAIRAIETQGACALGDQRIGLDETHGIVFTLDGRDVRRSRALLILPLQPGRVEWRSTAAWAEPMTLTGDILDGRWQTLETSTARKNGEFIRVEVSPDQALSLLLVCEKSAAARWPKIIERAMTDPGCSILCSPP